MSRKLLLVLLLVALSVPNTAFAQTTATTTTTVDTDAAIPTPSTINSTNRKDSVRDRLMLRNNTATPTPEDLTEEITAAQTARKAEIEKLRLAKKAATDAAREEFLTQLATIKDLNKQEVAEKISDNLSMTNSKATDRMFAVLDKLEAVLAKVEDKITEAKTNGTDTSAQELEVTNAKTALEAAKDTVTTQAAKDYIITVGTDTTLRSDISTVVNQQKQDLRTTYETVRSARQAVRQAAKALKDLGVMKVMPLPATSTLPSTGSGIVTTPANPIQ